MTTNPTDNDKRPASGTEPPDETTPKDTSASGEQPNNPPGTDTNINTTPPLTADANTTAACQDDANEESSNVENKDDTATIPPVQPTPTVTATMSGDAVMTQAVAAATAAAIPQVQQPHETFTFVTTTTATAPIAIPIPIPHTMPMPMVMNEEETICMSKATEEAVSLAAMQEAATIVMEAENQKKRKADDNDDSNLDLNDFSETQPKKRTTPTRVSWEDRLKQLEDYKQQHADLLIPIRYKLNPSLGKFVHNTREQYKLFHKQTPEGYKKKCSLTAERIRQLEQLGFAWTTERTKQQNEDWQARLKQLQDFKQEHGHCLVPHGYSSDPSFAEWIHRQRTTYASMLKDTKGNSVVKQRMEHLRGMGFNFTVHSDKWTDHWHQLKQYKEKHGDCQVPTHFAENPKLGRWVHTQRHQRRLQAKGKKSCMTQERIDLLDQLGFSWEVRPSLERPRATWQQRLEELSEFKSKHGHFNVESSNMPQLHAWCHEQRQRLRLLDKHFGKDVTKRMNPERVEALYCFGFTKDAELLEMKPDTTTKPPNTDDDGAKDESGSEEAPSGGHPATESTGTNNEDTTTEKPASTSDKGPTTTTTADVKSNNDVVVKQEGEPDEMVMKMAAEKEPPPTDHGTSEEPTMAAANMIEI